MCVNDKINAIVDILEVELTEIAKELIFLNANGRLPVPSRVRDLAETLQPEITSHANAISIVVGVANNLAIHRIANLKGVN